MRSEILYSSLTQLQEYILRTLLYYDIFNYPLKSDEVFNFLGVNHVDKTRVEKELEILAKNSYVHYHNGFFSVNSDQSIVTRRLKGNEMADAMMETANRRAHFIGQFPFVLSVMASGSLSKHYMDEDSDLDFFIITKPGRLWIARTLLVLYKRIVLFNSHKNFCVNYFMDAEHLEIEEKNLFTATELVTVIPLYGTQYYEQLNMSNGWVGKFFPNRRLRELTSSLPAGRGLFKKITEYILDSKMGDYFENTFMKATLRRWTKLYGRDYTSNDFKVAFKTTKTASKNHPKNHQKKVMQLYHEKIQQFGKKYNIQWTL
jgi:hypothetical protein